MVKINKVLTVVLVFTLMGSVAVADTLEVQPVGGAGDIRYFDGNVGIWTTNPLRALQIGDTSGVINLGGAPTSNGWGGIFMINSNSLKNWYLAHNYTIAGAFEIGRSTLAGGSTFTTPDFLISSTGNVGIGIAYPQVSLHNNGDFITKGPWVDVRAYASLSAAINDIGTSNKTLLIPNDQTLTSNISLPATLELWLPKGGSITLNGFTFTSAGPVESTGGQIIKGTGNGTVAINGSFTAGSFYVFSGFVAGDVTFGAGAVQTSFAEWFGWTETASSAVKSLATTSALASIQAVALGSNLRLQATIGDGTSGVDYTNTERGLTFVGMNSIGTTKRFASIIGHLADGSNGNEKGEIWFYTQDGGAGIYPQARIASNGRFIVSPTGGPGRNGAGLVTFMRGDGTTEYLLELQNLYPAAIGNSAMQGFSALNSANNEKLYGYMECQARNITVGSESGRLRFGVTDAGIDGKKHFFFDEDGALWNYRKRIIPKTTNYSIDGTADTNDSACIFTNSGASTDITIDLPDITTSGANRSVGVTYTFITVASYRIILHPYSGETIYPVPGIVNKKLQSAATTGNSITLVALQDGIWQVLSQIGSWTDGGI